MKRKTKLYVPMRLCHLRQLQFVGEPYKLEGTKAEGFLLVFTSLKALHKEFGKVDYATFVKEDDE